LASNTSLSSIYDTGYLFAKGVLQCLDLQNGYKEETRVLEDRQAIHLEPVWINLKMGKEKSPLNPIHRLMEVIDRLLRRTAARGLWVVREAWSSARKSATANKKARQITGLFLYLFG